MTQATTTNQEPILKRLYGNNIADPLYKRSKFAMMMKKDTSFGGEGKYVNVKLSGTAGGSADFATALASEAPTNQKRFFVTHRKEYQLFSIQGDLIARTKGDKNAMIDAVKSETDGALYSFWRNMAARIWGNQGGARAQLSASVTLGSVNMLLRNPGDIVNFEVGMKLQFSLDDGTPTSPAGLLDSGEQLTVVSINKAGAIVVVSANLSTIASITVDSYVFRAGDYAVAMTGVRGWNPTVAPSAAESFFGVDRTVGDRERQYGLIYNGGSDTYNQTIMRSLSKAHDIGISVTTMFVNSVDFGEIGLEVGSAKQVWVEDKQYRFGFDALRINGPDGSVNIVAEPDVPQGYYWANDPSMFTLRTAGECPMPLNEDTGKLLQRLESDDAYRGRFGAYGNVFADNPGNSVQGAW